MLTTFDPDKGPLFKGEFTKIEVIDPAIAGHVPNLVIDPSKPFEVHLEWQLSGTDVPLYMAALNDNWSVEVFAESLGNGPELRIGFDSVPKANGVGDGVTTPMVFKSTVVVAPSTLVEGTPSNNASGIYKLVSCVFLNSSLGAPGFDIAGFAEGPIIKAENPV